MADDGVIGVDELHEIVRRVEQQLSSEKELSLKYAEQNLSTAYCFWVPSAFLVGIVLTMIFMGK